MFLGHKAAFSEAHTPFAALEAHACLVFPCQLMGACISSFPGKRLITVWNASHTLLSVLSRNETPPGRSGVSGCSPGWCVCSNLHPLADSEGLFPPFQPVWGRATGELLWAWAAPPCCLGVPAEHRQPNRGHPCAWRRGPRLLLVKILAGNGERTRMCV